MRTLSTNFLEELRELHLRFIHFYSQALARAGLTQPQYVLLSQLSVFGPMCLTEASRCLSVTKPAITHLVRRLEEENLIQRKLDSHDLRSFQLSITPTGIQVVAGVQALILSKTKGVLEELNEEEQATVLKYFEKMSDAMESTSNEEVK